MVILIWPSTSMAPSGSLVQHCSCGQRGASQIQGNAKFYIHAGWGGLFAAAEGEYKRGAPESWAELRPQRAGSGGTAAAGRSLSIPSIPSIASPPSPPSPPSPSPLPPPPLPCLPSPHGQAKRGVPYGATSGYVAQSGPPRHSACPPRATRHTTSRRLSPPAGEGPSAYPGTHRGRTS